MEIRYLLQLFRRYRTFVAASAGLACLLALAATYVIPEKFESTTMILIRPRQAPVDDQTSKSMMDYPVSFNIPVDSMSKTYAQIMDSDAVVARVVDLLHLDTATPPQDPRRYMRVIKRGRDLTKRALLRSWEFVRYGRIEPKDPRQEAIAEVKRSLVPAPVTDTFLFSLTASASDAQLAAQIANTAATVFIDYTRSARSDEESTGARDIQQRLQTVQSQLEDTRSQLQAFGDGTSAAALDRQLQLDLDELAKFQAEREDVLKELDGLRAETATLRGQMASQSEAVRSSTTVARNPVVGQIEEALAKYQIDYAGLSNTLEPSHPQMQDLKARIEEAQRNLAAASQQVPDRDTSALNETREQIEQKLLDRVAQLQASTAHLTALRRTIGQYQSEIASLTGQKSQLGKLNLDLDVHENEFRLLSREEAQATLASIQQIGEIRQLHEAVAPVYPARPIKIYYASAGLAFGLLFALSLILISDYVDPRVHDVEGFRQTFNVPVVATITGVDARALAASPFSSLFDARTSAQERNGS